MESSNTFHARVKTKIILRSLRIKLNSSRKNKKNIFRVDFKVQSAALCYH